ncbi:hypothetical protein AB0I60_00530 [Actinosynnema sp. NPDC050436]|uniref:hypothetical protein n=1 Tax=Actinosynnema sp. NPDC050436 TaxID=3155659 RepID=UPI0033F549B6
MRRIHLSAAVLVIAVALVLLVVPIWLLNAAQYQALAAGVQALGVTAALVFGAATLLTDSRNRRVDRVLDLHAALTSGAVQESRVRLLLRLQDISGNTPSVSLHQLRNDAEFVSYPDPAQGRPLRDVNVVLRFFERVNAARTAGIVDLPLLHELLGGHVVWWDRVITDAVDEPHVRGLKELAVWVHHHSDTRASGLAYLESWRRNLHRDFGRPAGADEPTPT